MVVHARSGVGLVRDGSEEHRVELGGVLVAEADADSRLEASLVTPLLFADEEHTGPQRIPAKPIRSTESMTMIHTLDELNGHPHANVFPDAEPKTIRLTLDEGEEVAPHTHPDRDIVFYLVEGEIELQLGDRTHELTAGDVARFEGDQEIAPRAVQESTALIVLAAR